MNKKYKIVVSATNLTEGGGLTILQEFANNLKTKFLPDDVLFIINSKKLIPNCNFNILELPLPKKSWLIRLYYEYIWFYKFSKRNFINTWISLHDISPNVNAKNRIVYCHNPSPFYKGTIFDLLFDTKFYLFTKFYKYLYKINIKKNNYIIVQQNWIKNDFKRLFNVKNVISCKPIINNENSSFKYINENKLNNTFLYPTLPRTYKNVELIINASKLFNKKNYTVLITISRNENAYSKYLFFILKNSLNIKFIGRQTKDQMKNLYCKSSCVIFTSKIETWGLPLSEAISYNLPIICLDLPFSRETIGNYRNVRYISNNTTDLVEAMNELIINKKFNYEGNLPNFKYDYSNWGDLISFIKSLNSDPSL